jgi:hypothetical protein
VKIVATCEDFSARESRELTRMNRMKKPRKTGGSLSSCIRVKKFEK